MNYFIDTEFVEGTQKKMFGETKPTIDLISIGIVCEDGREYYAISKDFNLKEAWNRWQQRTGCGDYNNTNLRLYWIRENVLKPIYNELISEEYKSDILAYHEFPFNYSSMKYLIKKYGKSNKQIAEEIKSFTRCINPLDIKYIGNRDNYRVFQYTFMGCNEPTEWLVDLSIPDNEVNNTILNYYNMCEPENVQFYSYYSDYDWVVFCWLFGHMIDLPKGFPMYCNDLRQTMKEICDRKANGIQKVSDNIYNSIKSYPNYPKQTNEHNALSDARWNRDLYNFLKTM
jgi:hypothetical protein